MPLISITSIPWKKKKQKNFQQAHALFKEGKSKKKISQELKIRRPTIIEWLSRESYEDNRGWEKDKARKYTDNKVADRIIKLRERRIKKKKYFIGSDHLQMDYAKGHAKEIVPSKWFIEETIRDNKLQTRKPKKRKKGGAAYLLYPTESIRGLGYIHQSADFIGKKYIAGRSEPVNIFSTCYHAPIKIYQIQRILAEKSTYAIEFLEKFWLTYPLPDVFRIDNSLQFRGTASGKRAIGRFLILLLNLGITPLFGSPSKPWTNPHVEGHNRVFNEKVWNTNHFLSLEQIDTKCERFNQESKELFKFRYATLIVNNQNLFRYLEKNQKIDTDKLQSTKNKKIYFTRFAESLEKNHKAQIIIMNEDVCLPEKYTHQFVFVKWDLENEQLFIYSEYQKVKKLIKKQKFKINF